MMSVILHWCFLFSISLFLLTFALMSFFEHERERSPRPAVVSYVFTRKLSGDEIANVNFLRRHRTRTTKYNRLVHKIRHRSTRLCVRTQVYQIWQIWWNNAMQRPLRRSRSFKVTDFGTNRKPICDFLLVINTNLPPILHRFQVLADYWSNFC